MARTVLAGVRDEAAMPRIRAARAAADAREAKAERLEALAEIVRAVAAGGALTRLLDRLLRGERIAGYLDGQADGYREALFAHDADQAEAEEHLRRIGLAA